MNSTILGRLNFDDALLQEDIAKILQFGDVKEEYSEYRFGTWKNYVLWNGTGKQKDTLFVGVAGGTLKTELGRQLAYVNSVLEANFHTEKLKMVRANLLQDAVLVPHRDYVEFKSDAPRLARLHIPLKTDLNSLHSEDGHVFHMRQGEVWYLDVFNIHSACNLSVQPRISLVLDFCLDGAPLESLFKSPPAASAKPQPLLLTREPADENFLRAIASLKYVINEANYKDIVLLLSRVHFYKDVSQSVLFDWLIEMCKAQGNQALVEKSINFKTYMIKERALEQRFHL